MPTTRNGEVELYYEAFGRPGDPTLLLVNGLGSQCIYFAEEWCEKFVAHGYEVVRSTTATVDCPPSSMASATR